MECRTAELAVIIPVYNEEQVIANVLEKWSSEFDRLGIYYQIHVYNDGSRDNTLEILTEHAAKHKQITVHNKENSGHGPTILAGYRDNCDKTWIFQVDSDNEMNPDHFHQLWNKRDEFDLLIGRRHNRKVNFSRGSISFFSRMVVKIFFGPGIYDVNAPYRLMQTAVFKDYFTAITSDCFAPNVIISGIACLEKLRIYEISVPYNFRQTGEVSIKKIKLLKAAIKSLVQTIQFRLQLKGDLAYKAKSIYESEYREL